MSSVRLIFNIERFQTDQWFIKTVPRSIWYHRLVCSWHTSIFINEFPSKSYCGNKYIGLESWYIVTSFSIWTIENIHTEISYYDDNFVVLRCWKKNRNNQAMGNIVFIFNRIRRDYDRHWLSRLHDDVISLHLTPYETVILSDILARIGANATMNQILGTFWTYLIVSFSSLEPPA